MKKWLLMGVFFLTLALTACNNFNFGNPVGTSSVTISLGDRSLTKNQDTGVWSLQFTLNAHTLPGSPAGVINSFTLDGGGTLTAGLRVESCPATSQNDCGPFSSVAYTEEFFAIPPAGSVVVTAYTIVGENGAVYTQKLADPLVIR